MPTSSAPLFGALRATWTRLQTDVPELPGVRFTLSGKPASVAHPQSRLSLEGEESAVVGPELSADTVREGAEAVLTAVLHEAAHILCWVRGQTDTQTRGRYHTRVWLVAAEEVGLLWQQDELGGREQTGFAGATLSIEARAAFRHELELLEKAIPTVLAALPERPRRSAPPRRTLFCSCAPARSVLMKVTDIDAGPVVCGVCGQPFDAP